ncbi:MAG: hypothetical protein ACK5Y2_04565 [Bdellovibrionales bacterium]
MYAIVENLPEIPQPERTLLIYDQVLARNSSIFKWIRGFSLRYSVRSGEGLKDVRNLPAHLQKILGLKSSFDRIVVLGGGSVGDFGGFIASIYHRGVPVHQIPSTWLAALDSAHGGKTALNVGGFKNPVGTFHFPEKVWIVREVLESQPSLRLHEASGEFLKTAMIGGESLLPKLASWDWWNCKIEWQDLKNFIEVKYKVVKADPLEKSGHRHILNLGHTMGHVWEARFGLPHGLAVFHGLLFDLAWSVHEGHFPASRSYKMMDESPWNITWDRQFQDRIDQKLFSLSPQEVRRYLLQDKKLKADGLRCTFVQKPGQILVKKRTVDQILKEYQRQRKILEEFYENL